MERVVWSMAGEVGDNAVGGKAIGGSEVAGKLIQNGGIDRQTEN